MNNEKCALCHKLKSEHYQCSTNNNIFWCYPNKHIEGYDEKKHLKKWAYQFTTKEELNKSSLLGTSDKKE